ncbi:hypothetical protein GCM10023350_25430 [Nocardioides endophyticus]|uniref:Uncharacterized protein n=1 Tax=Nocardioides endophyticus TaxID=1353775 RepID=A0ABP8YUG3_9ACTN
MSSETSSAAAAWIKIVLGALLLLFGVRQWRRRPKAGEVAALPTWMAAIDSFTFVKALGLGLLLSAVNPKNLLMCIAAGSAIGSAGLGTSEVVAAIAIFTLIAASTGGGARRRLPRRARAAASAAGRAAHWLQANHVAVMSVLLLVIGVVLLGQGIGGL